jgi:glycosyltransferase involved in cell wall biosynthesis
VRICLVTSSYSRYEEDGNARFIRSIAEAQAALGHEVHVVAPYAPEVRPYPSPVHVHWFRYVWPARLGVMGHAKALENDRALGRAVVWQAPLFSLSLLLAVWRVVRRYPVDLIHAHWVLPAGFLASLIARLTGKPFAVSLHGSDAYLALRRPLFGRMAHWALGRAAAVTGSSQPLVDAAIALGALPEHSQVIPYGADPARFGGMDASPDLRRRLGLSADDRVVLAVGRLVGKKGFVHLVRAMPGVLAAAPQTRLVILGDGPERAALEHARDELGLNGNVILPGATPWPEIPHYLALCDVFAMPSVVDAAGNLDGLPNVILEAMAAGRPVVATRIAGIPLAVQDDQTGILVDGAAPAQLGAALLRVLTAPDRGRSMGQAGRARIESELNWAAVARRLDEMYRAAFARHSA